MDNQPNQQIIFQNQIDAGFRNYLELIEKGFTQASLLDKLDGPNAQEAMPEIYKRLNYFLGAYDEKTGQPISLPQEIFQDKEKLKSIYSRLITVLNGGPTYKGLPTFLETIWDRISQALSPGAAYVNIIPEIEELGKQIGYGALNDAKYEEIKSKLEQITDGKISDEEARKIAESFAKRHFKALKEKGILGELMDDKVIEQLVELFADVWTDAKATQNGKIFYTITYMRNEVDPYAEQNKDKFKEYFKGVSDYAINTGKALEFESYKKALQTIYGINEKTGALLKLGQEGKLIEASMLPYMGKLNAGA